MRRIVCKAAWPETSLNGVARWTYQLREHKGRRLIDFAVVDEEVHAIVIGLVAKISRHHWPFLNPCVLVLQHSKCLAYEHLSASSMFHVSHKHPLYPESQLFIGFLHNPKISAQCRNTAKATLLAQE